MKIKLKHNQPRENLIFNVKKLTDAYDCNCEVEYIIGGYIQDVNIATAQNNHEDLVQALNGLKGAIATQENNDLKKLVYRLIGQVDMD